MGIKTHELVTFDEKSHYAWLVWCPACDAPHSFDGRRTFNGNHEAPSFQASMLVHESPGHPRCHSFLTDGGMELLRRFDPRARGRVSAGAGLVRDAVGGDAIRWCGAFGDVT